MSIVFLMKPKNICDACPHTQPSQFVWALFCIHEEVRRKLASNIEEQTAWWKQLERMFTHLTIVCFGGPDFRVEAATAYVVTQCLKSIWSLGNRGLDCQTHHMRDAYAQAGRWPLCLRKYMMEETILFLSGLWEGARHNEEQFLALLKDKWSIHQWAFMF